MQQVVQTCNTHGVKPGTGEFEKHVTYLNTIYELLLVQKSFMIIFKLSVSVAMTLMYFKYPICIKLHVSRYPQTGCLLCLVMNSLVKKTHFWYQLIDSLFILVRAAVPLLAVQIIFPENTVFLQEIQLDTFSLGTFLLQAHRDVAFQCACY